MKNNHIIGTVMKVTNTEIVLLLDNGAFKNIQRKHMDQIPLIGQRFEYMHQRHLLLPWIKYAAIASIILLAIISISLIKINKHEPAYLIAVDINPSIEISLDSKHQIIEVRGNNQEGQDILHKLTLNKRKPTRSIHQFMEDLISQAVLDGYLQDEMEYAIIQTTFIPMIEEQSFPLEELEQSIHTSLTNHSVSAELSLEIEKKEVYEEAKEVELSIHQYKMYHKLKDNQLVDKIDEVKGKSIKELHQKNQAKIKNNKSPKNNSQQKKAEVVDEQKSETRGKSEEALENRNNSFENKKDSNNNRGEGEKSSFYNNPNSMMENKRNNSSANNANDNKQNGEMKNSFPINFFNKSNANKGPSNKGN